MVFDYILNSSHGLYVRQCLHCFEHLCGSYSCVVRPSAKQCQNVSLAGQLHLPIARFFRAEVVVGGVGGYGGRHRSPVGSLLVLSSSLPRVWPWVHHRLGPAIFRDIFNHSFPTCFDCFGSSLVNMIEDSWWRESPQLTSHFSLSSV